MAHHAGTGFVRAAATPAFQPYVPASQSPAEFTLKAVVIGVLFGLIFGASTVYLGPARRADRQRLDSRSRCWPSRC